MHAAAEEPELMSLSPSQPHKCARTARCIAVCGTPAFRYGVRLTGSLAAILNQPEKTNKRALGVADPGRTSRRTYGTTPTVSCTPQSHIFHVLNRFFVIQLLTHYLLLKMNSLTLSCAEQNLWRCMCSTPHRKSERTYPSHQVA